MTSTRTKEKLLSVSEVAKRYGISHQTAIRAVRAKRIPAHKVGWFWVIPESTLPAVWPGRK